MKKIITRYIADLEKAHSIAFEMIERQRFSSRIVSIYDRPEGLVDVLTAQAVNADAAKVYQARMVMDGGVVLMVRAGNRPLAVAKKARTILADMGASELGDITEEVAVREERGNRLSYFRDNPHILTRPSDRPYPKTNYFMADWPIGHISRRKPFNQMLFPPHSRMASWPVPLISRRKPRDAFIFPRHARMADFPIPLISRRKPRDAFAFPRHARMANFPIPLISKRKPYKGSLIPRHGRMATWPFPLLINGKTGQNALMPGAPRMANSPIPLLSRRKPRDAFAFPRHARMGNFPLPLISKRKPRDAFAFPRHARMANMILPLVISRDSTKTDDRKGFSLSRMLGLPTIIRR